MYYTKLSSYIRKIAASGGGPIPKRSFGKTGLDVTILGLGGGAVVGLKGKENESKAEGVIRAALRFGVNYFDTSPEYGPSEVRIGSALGKDRPSVVLATKTHDRTRDGSLRLLEASLKALKTDHVDVWQMHHIDHEDEVKMVLAKDGALKALQEAKSQGMTRYIGVTGHYDPAPLSALIKTGELDTALLAMNAADVHDQHSFIKGVLPSAIKARLGVVCMKVASMGRIFNPWNLNNIRDALYYCLSLPVSTAIIGVDDEDQLAENVTLVKMFEKLSDDEMGRIHDLTEEYHEIANFFRKGHEVHNPFWKPYGYQGKKASDKGKRLIILRGISGTGKSTLARDLEREHKTKALGSDDFFMKGGKYIYDMAKLSEAHSWNQQRVRETMKRGDPVVIVDNTNTQAWEMKPYVQAAKEFGYSVEFKEPGWSPKLKDEQGKWNVDFIEKLQRNKDRSNIGKTIPREVLERMRDRYQYGVTEEDVLKSQMPEI
jgi:aryl-alcohol dehydrogenase-like predicted oxidoreductase/predicted kinase